MYDKQYKNYFHLIIWRNISKNAQPHKVMLLNPKIEDKQQDKTSMLKFYYILADLQSHLSGNDTSKSSCFVY